MSHKDRLDTKHPEEVDSSEQHRGGTKIPTQTAEFGDPGGLRDRLVAAIARGEKTATSSLLVEYELDDESLPHPGERLTVLDSCEQPVAVIEVATIDVLPLKDVGLDIALAEGEGFTTIGAWRRTHEDFWNSYRSDIRERLDDPTWRLTDETPVFVERFKLVDTLQLAQPDA